MEKVSHTHMTKFSYKIDYSLRLQPYLIFFIEGEF